jgi:hypothetical protein
MKSLMEAQLAWWWSWFMLYENANCKHSFIFAVGHGIGF